MEVVIMDKKDMVEGGDDNEEN
jgi:hypothetical protein